MSLYSQFQTDPELEKKGIYLDYGQTPDGKDIRFLVARAGGANDTFNKRMEAKPKPYRRQIQTESIPTKTAERLILEVYCETVVLGWQNVRGEDDVEIPFSSAAAQKLFTDLPELYVDVMAAAGKAALFRKVNLEADAGN